MSGFAICLELSPGGAPERLISRMIQGEACPAPHGVGLKRLGSVHLGCCRWWTTPEEVGEPLPLADEAGRYWLAGEVRLDNRQEIAARLREVDESPSGSDARLLLTAYRRWGSEAFRLCVGDFALAIWDEPRRRLVCARDALGRRDLVYHVNAQRFLCASTLRQLFCDESLPRCISEPAAAHFLLGDLPPAEATFFAHIQRLPAGCLLEVEPDGRRRVTRFWDPQAIEVVEGQPADWYAERFRDAFLQAVRSRLRTTSPALVHHVSGGFDSAAVVGAAHYWKDRELPDLTPSALFAAAAQAAADESRYLRHVLDRYPMPLDTCAMEEHWAFRPHPLLEKFYDEPFPPVYGSRLIAELEIAQRRGAQVILSGDGGDEVGGSGFYLADLLARGKLRMAARELQTWTRGKPVLAWRPVYRLARMHAGWWRRRWRGAARRPPPWVAPELLRRAGLEGRLREESPRGSPAGDFHYRKLEFCWRLPAPNRSLYALLGVEVRQPFLDRRVVEWALTVPPFRWGEEGRLKAPLRRALADLLPPAILQRSDKGNYLYYWDLGVRDKERRRIEQLLQDPVAAQHGCLDPHRLRAEYQAYCAGKPIDRSALGNAIRLEQWLRGVSGQG